jgi:hypothetical protein
VQNGHQPGDEHEQGGASPYRWLEACKATARPPSVSASMASRSTLSDMALVLPRMGDGPHECEV